MADYHPLIARAVDGLADPTPEARRSVYERARTALLGQLRSLDPPLSAENIERESRSLDDAIARVEASYASMPDAQAKVEPIAAAPRIVEPPPAPIAPFTAPVPASQAAPPAPPPAGPPEAPLPEPDPDATARPRVGSRAPVRDSAGRGRTVLFAAILLTVIAAIAVLAWLQRDNQAAVTAQAPAAQPTPATPAPDTAKFNERVGGAQAPAAAASAAATPAPARQDAGIAQRAVFYEEDTTNPQKPKAQVGKVTWRLDSVSGGQGQPLETAVRGTVDIPEAGLTMVMLIRRNLDQTLPASHTVELTFTTRPGDTGRVIRDVGLLQFKNEEAARGTPIAGLPVPVRENLFLIGLSNLSGDVERNVELFVRRNWLDLPVRMASGQRAILSFEKGASGEQVMTEAFRQWQ